MTIELPKTERRITGKIWVDRLIEYVKKHDFPKFHTQTLVTPGEKEYALCSQLYYDEDDPIIVCMKKGIIEPDEELQKFEGGIVISNENSYDTTHYILVNDHFYYLEHI